MFLNFQPLFLKMQILEAVAFFLAYSVYPINSIFQVEVEIHKIHVFGEVVFLLVIICMITGKKFFPVFMAPIAKEKNSFITIMQLINPISTSGAKTTPHHHSNFLKNFRKYKLVCTVFL